MPSLIQGHRSAESIVTQFEEIVTNFEIIITNGLSALLGDRGGARGVLGGATSPQKFCLAPPVAPQNFSSLFLKVLHRPLTAPLVAKLAPPVAPPNENVWLRPCWVSIQA